MGRHHVLVSGLRVETLRGAERVGRHHVLVSGLCSEGGHRSQARLGIR